MVRTSPRSLTRIVICVTAFVAWAGCRKIDPDFYLDEGSATGTAEGTSGSGTSADTGTNTVTSGVNTSSSTGADTGTEETGQPPADVCDEDDPELVACYDFQSLAGDLFVDGSMYGNDVALSGAAIVGGPFGNAFDVQPLTKAAAEDSRSLDINGPMTIEGWIRLRSLPDPGDRQGIMDNEGQYSAFIYGPDELRCRMGFDDVSATLEAIDEWTHFACVYDGAEIRAYINAQRKDTVDGSGDIPVDDITPMVLGNAAVTLDEPLDGLMDSFRIWNTSHDDDEVCSISGVPDC